jgi:hypothetical protein
MKTALTVVSVMLMLAGCQPEPKVSDQIHRRAERRVAELTAEIDQAQAVQRSLERTLIVAGCAVAVLVVALVRLGGRKGG